jgi:hypothetical protein
VLFFIDLERRKVFLAGVTAHTVGAWVPARSPASGSSGPVLRTLGHPA